MDTEQTDGLLGPSRETLAAVKVFPLIPNLKADITAVIDSPLSWEQLTASDINFSVVRPLVFQYARLDNLAVIYACMVVRSFFLTESQRNLSYSGVMFSRASLCELMAIKLAGYHASHRMQLAAVLTTSWNPLAGAPADVVTEIQQLLHRRDDQDIDPQSALEMAVFTQSKAFLSSPIVQQIVNDIYTGRIIFSSVGGRSILADNYKPRPIEIYDVRTKPFLDHYRLRVPRYSNFLEFINISLMLLFFVVCLSMEHDYTRVSLWETLFVIMVTAFALGEYTSANEHGWSIYIANMWNVFDTSFIFVSAIYLSLRTWGLYHQDVAMSKTALDILACGACVLIPRLVFFVVSTNVVVLALRAMISQYVLFMGIATVCFTGLLYTLWFLGKPAWTVQTISWLMLQTWFGNSFLSFSQASSFHPWIGPILMTLFACISNTLLITILISILSNTVAIIDANATQEFLFQYALTTIEGVKSDALFSYQLPWNLLAFVLLKPASWFLTPRSLHSYNVFLIKITAFPILIGIGIYERYRVSGHGLRKNSANAAYSFYNSLPEQLKKMPFMESMIGSNSKDLYRAIFDFELTDEWNLFKDEEEEEEEEGGELVSAALVSRDRSRSRSRTAGQSTPRRNAASPPVLPCLDIERASIKETPRPRKISNLNPISETYAQTEIHGGDSPISRLFGPSASSVAHEAALKRMESVLESARELPVLRLKEEMQELQDRQARIESLLLTLTRGMRNDTIAPLGRQASEGAGRSLIAKSP